MLNDEVFVECASALGRRIADDVEPVTEEERIRHAFALCLGRPPDDTELDLLVSLQAKALEQYRADPDAASRLIGGAVADQLRVAEAASWMVVARTILNLDEFLTRE